MKITRYQITCSKFPFKKGPFVQIGLPFRLLYIFPNVPVVFVAIFAPFWANQINVTQPIPGTNLDFVLNNAVKENLLEASFASIYKDGMF